MRPAFSLIEVTIVLVIVGVIAAVALPKFAGASTNYRVQGAAQQLSAQIKLARLEARSAAAPRSLVVRNGALVVLDQNNAEIRRFSPALAPFSATLSTTFTDAAPLAFDAYGTPSAGGSFSLAVGHTQTQVLVSSAGQVSINSTQLIPTAAPDDITLTGKDILTGGPGPTLESR